MSNYWSNWYVFVAFAQSILENHYLTLVVGTEMIIEGYKLKRSIYFYWRNALELTELYIFWQSDFCATRTTQFPEALA